MSFLGAGRSTDGEGDAHTRPVTAFYEERRAVGSDELCEATLACDGCDAPVALGGRRVSLTEALSCPFCGRSGPVRDFLSLKRPTRPARVTVRISRTR
jgi:hypothetical protein